MGRKENGEGTWTTLPSGKVNCVKMYTAKNGEKKRISATADTKTECRRIMKQKEEEFESKSRMDMSTTGRLADNMEIWLKEVKRKDSKCGATTYMRIMSTFETHIKGSFLGNMKEEQVTDKDVIRFLSELRKHSQDGEVLKDKELSLSSKNKVYLVLLMYFNFKYIRVPELNPMLTVPKPVEETREEETEGVLDAVPKESVWTDEEMEQIHRRCMEEYHHGKLGSVKRGPLVAFLMWTFIRSGELMALRWSDICLESGNEHIRVSKTWKKVGKERLIGKPKSKKSNRSIELNTKAVEAIQEYRRRFPPESEDDFVCLGEDGEILCESTMRRMLNSILRGLGYDQIEGKDTRVHGLRHSGISYYIRKGVRLDVVSDLAGHSSTSVTEQVYVEIISDCRRDEIVRVGLAL